MNTNISSLQKIVEALQDNLSISKVEQISDGYIIHFSDGSTATIKNGKNSEDAPIIGVKKDTDGIYYWTLDGEWLTDEKGNKVKAQGTDGKDGVDGEDGNDGVDGEDGVDGTNGKDGKDGITPQLKIENGRWMLSMDNGKTWTDIGQATGADGKDGEDGEDGTDGEDGVDGKDGTNGIFKSVREDMIMSISHWRTILLSRFLKAIIQSLQLHSIQRIQPFLMEERAKQSPTRLRMQPKIRLSKPLHRMVGKSK